MKGLTCCEGSGGSREGGERSRVISEILSEELDDASAWRGQKARAAAWEVCSGEHKGC